ncbi:MAG TPA: STAS domain-containing protein [Bacteroidota bacterium]|nr:STAS domain-containing protein [Bacteroidota bacterium]
MNLTTEMLDGGIEKISLFGRMDIDGTQEIETRLAAAASSDGAKIMLDLSGVDFMASIGIGILVSTAKSLRRRGGIMVLLNPQPVVLLVLERTQMHTLMPVCADFDEAGRMLRSGR